MELAFLLGLLLILLAMSVPIAFAMGIATVGYMVLQNVPLVMVAQRVYSGANNYGLIPLPLFILAGILLNTGGISDRIIAFATALVGHIRGGMALVNIVASMLFAGVSGSAVADTAALGSILIPSMRKKGYPAAFSAAVTASSATIGIIIPPSIPMIMHGFVAGVSVTTLFLAGIIPGILVGLGQMVVAYVISRRNGYPTEGSFSWINLWRTFVRTFPALVAPLIILGGITSGIFTATEAGAVASVYALLLVGIFYRSITWRQLYQMLVESGITTATVMLVVAVSSLLGWALSFERVPQTITAYFLGLTTNPLLTLIIITIFLIFAGTILHGSPLQLIIVPMFLPLVNSLGIDPILFGIVVVFCVGIGQQTPPVGSALFVTSALAETDLMTITRWNWPLIGVITLIMYTIILVPDIALFLPRVLGY
jgi:tripartite ATP-independent transporter DctM subunit